MSWYINSKPTDNGHYGNPQSNSREDSLELPDELLSAYIDTMGFATLDVDGGVVTALAINQAAYDAYQEEHRPVELTPAEKREQAYNEDACIELGGEMITVTAAATLWQYYAAEGNEKADELQALIAAAKAAIREQYPDE